MIVLIVGVLITLVCAVFIGMDAPDEGLFTLIMGAAMTLFVTFFLGCLVYMDPGHTETSVRVPLQDIADRMNVSGTFFLFGGSVGGYPEYAWYEKVGPNAYEQRSAEADISTIHYVAQGQQPYYTERLKVDGGSWLKPWGIDIGTGDIEVEHYDFYVPAGTITHDYRLDTQ